MLVQSTRQADDAGKVAELEAAQAAAQGALLAEMDLLRRQKAAAEEQARRMETQVYPNLPLSAGSQRTVVLHLGSISVLFIPSC